MIPAVISCQHCWDHYERDRNISEVLNCYNDLRSCEENIALKVPYTTWSTWKKRYVCIALWEKKSQLWKTKK